MQLTKEELFEVQGGSITASFLNALSRAASTILDIGRSIGSSLRRMVTRNYC